MLATGSIAPVPLKLAMCGLPGALSVTVIVAVRVPVAVGANFTVIAQEAPPATEFPQLSA